MTIYVHTDYRKILKSVVDYRRLLDKSFGFHQLAKAAKVQPSYMSKVMKKDANLSSDQMFLITECLEFNEEQQDYMQLLLEAERTSHAKRKRALKTRLRLVQDRHLKSEEYLSATAIEAPISEESMLSDYYLNPLLQVVHIAIAIEQFGKCPSLLADQIGITTKYLYGILDSLVKMGLVEVKNKQFIPKEPKLHLSSNSALYRSWRNQIRLLADQKMSTLESSDYYSFSAVISAFEEARTKMQEKFLVFLRECENLVEDAPSEQVFQICFDLLPWTKPLRRYS